MTATLPMTQVPLWRKLLAGALGLVGAILLAFKAGFRDTMIVLIPVIGPVIAAFLVHLRSLGPQLVARAIWWSSLGLGVIVAATGSRSEQTFSLAMAMGCGAALLVIGRKGLAEASERASYVPAAFRSSLLLLMVLALADAQTLGFFAIIERDRGSEGAVPFALGALAFTVGFIGLYRLALWGALVNAAAALILFFLSITHTVKLHRDLDTIIPVLMGLQMLAATPMLLALIRGKPLPALSPRARGILTPVAILLLMAVSASISLMRYER